LPTLSVVIFADFTCADCWSTEAALWARAKEDRIIVHCRAATLENARGPDTTKAHEAAKLAREEGVQEAMRYAIYRAVHQEGVDIGRIDRLQRIGTEVGLDPFDLKVALDIDRYRDEVLRERELARSLGIRRGPVVYLGSGPGARILIGPQTEAAIGTAILNF
jgi:predicted DsbA family dithiol-disulfide isomerase